MKKTLKRIISALLVAIMILGSAPLGALTDVDFNSMFNIEAEAASYTIEGKNTVSIPIGEYTHMGPVFRDDDGYGNCWAFAQMVYKKVWDTNFTYYRNTNDDMLRNVTGGAARKVTAENAKKFITAAAPGAVIRMCGEYIEGSDGLNGGKTTKLHSVMLVSKDSNGCVIYDSNVNYGTEKNPDCRTRLRHYTWKEFESTFGVFKYFKYIKWPGSEPYNVSITLSNPSAVSNEGAVISAKLNHGFNIQKIAYFISTEPSIAAIDGTNTKNHKDNDYVDFILDKDHSSNTKGMTSFNITMDEHLKEKLMPDTKYYYKVLVKTGNKWYQSPIDYFITTDYKPQETKFTVEKYDIGFNDVVTVSWGKSEYAKSYKVELFYNNECVYQKDDIQGTSLAFPGVYFNQAGKYYARLTAKNETSELQMTSEAVINVHFDVHATFVDSITGEIISQQKITYGHDATEPAVPTPYGYTFTHWDGNYTNITQAVSVFARYKKNVYTVKFVDGMTGKTLDTQKVEYLSSANAPTVSSPAAGYEFVGWDVPYDEIKEDTTVTAVYKWYDSDYPIVSEIVSVNRHETKDGYDVTVKVSAHGNNETVQGRLVIAARSASGYQFAETESQAFSLNVGETETIYTYVPCAELADSIAVYSINSYDNAGPIAPAVFEKIEYDEGWSEWIEYTGETPPVDSSVKYETKTSETLYRYRTKSETQSTATSLAGWTQNGFYWKSNGTKTLDYVKNWPSGFSKNHELYETYNVTPKTNSESATTKIVNVSETASDRYIYWHWCPGRSISVTGGPTNWYITDAKEYCQGVHHDTFHAFESKTYKGPHTSGANYCKYNDYNKTGCGDTYYWWLPIKIYTQTYETYTKYYYYYKWSEWSDWSATKVEADSKTEVETQPGKKYYRVYTNSVTVTEPTVADNQTVNVKGYVDPAFAGKDVTVYIHKYGRVSDYTNEFIGTTETGTVGENGLVEINNALLREAPSSDTGDFRVVASVKGNTNVVDVINLENPEQFEAPKKVYLVNYYDFDRETVIYSEYVEEGGSVTAPDGSETNPEEGYKFSSWSQSTVNVQDNLKVYPNKEKKTYVLVFVDWGHLSVTMYENMEHGSKIVLPATESVDGKNVEWDTAALTSDDNGNFILTENTVITTKYSDKSYTITYIKEGTEENYISDPENSNGGMDTPPVIEEADKEGSDNLSHGDHTDPPLLEKNDDPDYVFCGWRNIATGEYLVDTVAKSDGTYYPVYKFVDTAEVPVADIKTGEYSETQYVTLTSATENVDIYYTLDGSDPTDPDNPNAVLYEKDSKIEISKSCILAFYAMGINSNDSEIGSELYAINTGESSDYYIVTIENNLPYRGATSDALDYCCQMMVKEGALLPDLTEYTTVEGHTFNGLYTDSDFAYEFDHTSEPIFETVTLYASFTPEKHTATFKDEDGTVISISTVNYGESAQPPEDPEKAGYKFVGWSSDEYLCMKKDCEVTAVFVSLLEWATVSLPPKKSGYVGNGTSLHATVISLNSNEELTWESSDENVVTVDANGRVTYAGVGKAVVRVTVDSTREYAECVFTISENPYSKVVLSKNSALGVDEKGYIRGVKPNQNSVEEIKKQFANDEEDLIFVSMDGTVLGEADLVGTGTVVKLMSGNKVVDEKTIIMTGDYDGDGKLTGKEGSRFLRYTVGKENPNEYQLIAMDVNGDGYVNNRDTGWISRYLVGKETL